MISRDEGRAAGPLLAVALGLSAHAAAASCLPGPLPTLLVLPLTLLAVRTSDHCLRQRGLLARAAAGQAVVHAALLMASPCASHPGARDPGHVLTALDVVMTGVHLAALLLCVTLAGHLQRRLTGLLTLVAGWVRAVVAAPAPLQASALRRTAAGHQRAGFRPSQIEDGSCGLTRGPPTRSRCPAPA